MYSSIDAVTRAVGADPLGQLIQLTAKASALVLVATLAALLLHRASAATRHLVWSGAAVGLLLLPILSWTMPAWRVPLIPAAVHSADVRAAPATTESADVAHIDAHVRVPELHAPVPDVHAVIEPVPDVQADAVIEPESAPSIGIAQLALEAPASSLQWPSLADLGRGLLAWVAERVPAVVALWATGALLVLGWLGLGLLRVRTLVRTATPVSDRALAALAASLSREMGLAGRVRVLESGRSLMPMACGFSDRVVLLPSIAAEWPTRRQRDVLRHELAHLRRRDCLAHVVAVAACAVHWFNPLAWHALRRLRAECERAADDAALATGARATDYAESLLDVARTLRGSAFAPAAGIAMARPSQLEGRLLAILDRRRSRRALSRAALLPAMALVLAVVVPIAAFTPVAAAEPHEFGMPVAAAPDAAELPALVALPLVPEAPLPPLPADVSEILTLEDCLDLSRRSRVNSHTSNTNDGRQTIRIRRDGCEIEVEIEGKVRFNRSLTGIESISPGGSFELEAEVNGVTRRLRVRAGESGQVTHEFWVDGDRQPFDETARTWFAETLVALERYTGFAADIRVPQLLEGGGVDAVLREIALMPSDHAKGRYFELVLERDLSDAELEQVVRLAGKEIDSDYQLAQTLIAASEAGRFDDRLHPAYLEAIGTIDSDYEHRRVLSALLARERLAPEVVTGAIRSGARLRSDYEQAELLIAIAKRYPLNGAAREAYLTALQSVDSDYELRRVLSAFMNKGELTAQETATVLQAAQSIDSDYEQAELLLSLTKTGRVAREGWPLLMRSVQTIASDYERSRVLSSLLAERLADDRVVAILEATNGIESDHELAELLTKIARTQVVEGAVRDAFLRAAETIDSTYEYGRVMDALRRKAAL